MPINNYSKTKLSNQYTNEGGGLPADTGPYIGVVMDNVDPSRNGRVRVWLKTRGAKDKNNPANWRTVSYLSPFYGTTPFEQHDKSESQVYKNAHSYGMWMTSPDVGVEVLCIFVNGDPNLGYYIGYVPQTQMNHMIPATGARAKGSPAKTNSGGEAAAYAKAPQLPVVEIKKSEKNMENADFYNAEKPVHSILASQYWAQGTITDTIRGPIGSSVQRESPSYAYGISTPGRPIYKKALDESNMKSELESGSVSRDNVKVQSRRGGHSFVMDDGDLEGKDRLMRLRTSTGHQITMSDDGATIYIQHANGLTWIELGNEGTIDLYSANSVNVRTQGEINLHADKDINMYSGKNINMFAKENIKLECEKNFDIIGKLKTTVYSEKKVFIKSDGVLSTESAQITSIKAGGNIVEQGAKVLMNSGGAPSVQKPKYIPHAKLPDAELKGAIGWESVPGKLDTVVTRAPTHEPYEFHNQGVSVEVDLGTQSTAPVEPTHPDTQQFIQSANERPPLDNPVQPAEVVSQANNNE